MENLPLMDSIALNCTVYDEETFIPAFKEKASKAQFSLLMIAPNLTHFGLERLVDTIEYLVKNKRQVCIFVKPPDRYYDDPSTWDSSTRRSITYFDGRVRELRGTGAHVNFVDKEHKKVAVIDGRWTFDGSANILSFNADKTIERMTCIDSFYMALSAIAKHELFNCPDCHNERLKMPGLRYLLLSSTDLGAKIAEKRMARGLTQRQLAELSNVPRSVIANLEAGQANLTLETIVAILDALDEEVITVPRDSLPIIEQLLWSIKPGRLVGERHLVGLRDKNPPKQRRSRKSRTGTGSGDLTESGFGRELNGAVSDQVQKDAKEDDFTPPPDQPQSFDVPK